MGKISQFFTKKKVLVFGFLLFLINMVAKFSVDLGICPYYASECFDKSDLIISYTYIFIPFFVFSLITFKLKESTFSAWRNFSFFAIILSLVLISFLPTRTHGLDFVPVTKGTVIFGLTILYSIVSLILVAYKSSKKV